MKILIINTDDYLGGAAVASLRLKKALEENTDLQIKMLVQESRRDFGVDAFAKTWVQKKTAFARFALERLYFRFFEVSKTVRYAFSPANMGIDISQHPLVQEADVLHLHWVNFGFLSLNSLEKLFALGKPIVWTLHDMWAFTGGCHHSGTCEQYQLQCGQCKFLKYPSQNDLSNQIWQRKNRIFLNNQIKVVACSQWLANRAKQSSLCRRFDVSGIPNPIDVSVFSPANQAAVREKLNLPIDKKLILFAAMKVSAQGKGFAYFEQALALLERNDAELLIFGNADTELFESLPFSYHYLGKLNTAEQIADAYRAADVFVIPSLEENLPNTIMESLACGTPVVGFNVGGIPEMIDHQQNGYLATYKSVGDLAEGINWVFSQKTETLQTKSRQKVVRNYSEKIIAERYLEVYKTC